MNLLIEFSKTELSAPLRQDIKTLIDGLLIFISDNIWKAHIFGNFTANRIKREKHILGKWPMVDNGNYSTQEPADGGCAVIISISLSSLAIVLYAIACLCSEGETAAIYGGSGMVVVVLSILIAVVIIRTNIPRKQKLMVAISVAIPIVLYLIIPLVAFVLKD